MLGVKSRGAFDAECIPTHKHRSDIPWNTYVAIRSFGPCHRVGSHHRHNLNHHAVGGTDGLTYSVLCCIRIPKSTLSR
jgi:hypothetical protein